MDFNINNSKHHESEQSDPSQSSPMVSKETSRKKRKRADLILHHYAPCIYLPSIIETGTLFTSNAGAPDEAPLLWFSSNQQWEQTATKIAGDAYGTNLRLLTFAEQWRMMGCCRFSIPAKAKRFMHWNDACQAAGMRRNKKRKMESSGRDLGADPAEWFALAESLGIDELEFSVFSGTNWKSADLRLTARAWGALV